MSDDPDGHPSSSGLGSDSQADATNASQRVPGTPQLVSFRPRLIPSTPVATTMPVAPRFAR